MSTNSSTVGFRMTPNGSVREVSPEALQRRFEYALRRFASVANKRAARHATRLRRWADNQGDTEVYSRLIRIHLLTNWKGK